MRISDWSSDVCSSDLLGTSPFGFAAPTADDRTFLIDMAMSRVARGKLKFAAQRGEQVPLGYALDSAGRPTTDGKAAFEGTMLPFGEHKGAAMSWMMDVFAGVFTGGCFGGDVANPFSDLNRPQGTSHVFMAIRADLFSPMASFAERMAEMDRRAKDLPKAAGVERIMAPGEPEARKGRLRSEEHTSELQSLMRISYAVFCLKKKKKKIRTKITIKTNTINNRYKKHANNKNTQYIASRTTTQTHT